MMLVIIVGVILGILSYLLFKNPEQRGILTEEDVSYLFPSGSTEMIDYEQHNESGLDNKVLPSLYFELQPNSNGIEINTDCMCIEDLDDNDVVSESFCNCREFPTLISGSGQLKLIATFPSGTKNVKLKAIPSRSYLTNLSNFVPRNSQTIASLNINYDITTLANSSLEDTQIHLYLNDNDEPSVTLPLIVDKTLIITQAPSKKS